MELLDLLSNSLDIIYIYVCCPSLDSVIPLSKDYILRAKLMNIVMKLSGNDLYDLLLITFTKFHEKSSIYKVGVR